MTSKITLLVTMAVAQCMLLSCLSSSVEVTTYDDVAITSFSLGTVRCYRTVKASDGTDSTYSYTYSGTSFPMYIDQRNSMIYNADSLVAGSNLSRILVSIGTKNSGVVSFKNLSDDGYTVYSSSDSVDLSQDRTVMVYSNDGQYSRAYTVKALVHTEYADSFTWQAMTPNILEEIAAMKKIKAVATINGLFLLGNDGVNTMLLKSVDGNAWTTCGMNGVAAPLEAEATIAEFDEKIYLLNDGVLYSSEEGDSWTQISADGSLAAIAGGFKSTDLDGTYYVNEMYAVSHEAKIMVSYDEGATWVADNMEHSPYYDNSEYLPSTDINLVATNARMDGESGNVTIIANKALTEDDTYSAAVVWNKVADRGDDQDWFFTNTSWENHYYILPRMQDLSATYYADGIVAIGGEPVNNEAVAYSTLYYSPDQGATWHKQAGMRVPEGFSAASAATVVADGFGYIYLISNGDGVNGQVWKGRKNSETWETVQKWYR